MPHSEVGHDGVAGEERPQVTGVLVYCHCAVTVTPAPPPQQTSPQCAQRRQKRRLQLKTAFQAEHRDQPKQRT